MLTLRKYKKYKRDRCLGQNTHGLNRSSFKKRQNKPGKPIGKPRSRSTVYGGFLLQKQRLMGFYANIRDYQLKNIIMKSIEQKDPISYITRSLESRLDSFLFRSGVVKTFSMARQIIVHKQVIVDGKISNSPSYKLESGNVVTFKKSVFHLVQGSHRKCSPNAIIRSQSPEPVEIEFNSDSIENNATYAMPISLVDVIRYYRVS